MVCIATAAAAPVAACHRRSMAALLVLVLLAVPHRWGLAEAGLLRERHRQGHNAINIGTDRVSESMTGSGDVKTSVGAVTTTGETDVEASLTDLAAAAATTTVEDDNRHTERNLSQQDEGVKQRVVNWGDVLSDGLTNQRSDNSDSDEDDTDSIISTATSADANSSPYSMARQQQLDQAQVQRPLARQQPVKSDSAAFDGQTFFVGGVDSRCYRLRAGSPCRERPSVEGLPVGVLTGRMVTTSPGK